MNEAELLFSQALGCQRPDLYINKDKYLSREKSAFISAVLKRRIKGEPIQYILGKTEFMGLEIKVNKSVLIPRPETEVLVETALRLIPRLCSLRPRRLKILDLGTGSGCIGIALAKYLTDPIIDASDLSDAALGVARENAKLNNAKINFIQSDLFTSHKLQVTSYDIIISNPPYIAEGQIKKLQPELQFEPNMALNGAGDGLDFYRRIVLCAPGYLKIGGLLILEMGFGHAPALEEIFNKPGLLEVIEIVKDYNNIDRVIVLRKVK